MEFKEYIKIINKNYRMFFTTILIFCCATIIYFMLKPISYDTSLTLNISRKGNQETQDYKYDDYYRLQADEKFAETIVEWMKSPRIVTDIFSGSGQDPSNLSIKQLTKSFKAEKLSSQVVSINFNSEDEKTSRKISDSIIAILTANTENLNQNQKENAWFEIHPQEAVVVKKSYNFLLIFFVSLLIGAFLGFWLVLIKLYLKD